MLCKRTSCNQTALIYTYAINIGIWSGKINIFKNTSCMLLLWDTHASVWFNSFLCDGDNLARLYVTDKFSTDSVKCTAFWCQYIGITTLSDTQRSKAIWISCSNELSRTHDNKWIRSLDFFHCLCDSCLYGRLFNSGSCNHVRDNLRIDCRLKDCTCSCKLLAQLRRIDQVAIMCQA